MLRRKQTPIDIEQKTTNVKEMSREYQDFNGAQDKNNRIYDK